MGAPDRGHGARQRILLIGEGMDSYDDELFFPRNFLSIFFSRKCQHLRGTTENALRRTNSCAHVWWRHFLHLVVDSRRDPSLDQANPLLSSRLRHRSLTIPDLRKLPRPTNPEGLRQMFIGGSKQLCRRLYHDLLK